jgi:hypothetical protein
MLVEFMHTQVDNTIVKAIQFAQFIIFSCDEGHKKTLPMTTSHGYVSMHM